MAEKNTAAKKISMVNTKQEILNAYNSLLSQFQEKSKTVLRPEEEVEKKKNKEIVETAESLSSEGVIKEIGNLKLETGKMLTQLSDGLEEEVKKYKRVKEAIEIKEGELREVYDIEKEAQTLAVLIEAQGQKRREFEFSMADEKERLNREIQMMRAEWAKEIRLHDAELKERDAEEKKKRQREEEDYRYAFKRKQQSEEDKINDARIKQGKEFQLKKEQVEKQLAEREKKIIEKEDELKELQRRADGFPKEIETAVNKANKGIRDELQLEAANKAELFKKSFEGERNVSVVKIEALEKATKEQREQILKLSQQLEKAYQKVQEMAVKAVSGVSDFKSLINSQPWIVEQIKKQSQEK